MSWRRLISIPLLAIIACGIAGTVYVHTVLSRHNIRPRALYNAVVTRTYDVRTVNGKVAMLILGISGGEHDGNDLTDSMTVAVFDAAGGPIRLISLPRDIWAPSIQDKINSIYHYGELSEAGTGLQFTERTLSELLGIPITYAMTLDFSGFERIVDAVGGITVNVGAGFTDEWYPVTGRENDDCGGTDPDYRCRYTTVTFAAGPARMDGATALTYVRSRHADSEAGSDFDRGRRQQEVLVALRRRLTDLHVLTSPSMLSATVHALTSAVTTDMEPETAAVLSILAARTGTDRIIHASVSGLLTEGDGYGGRYVLVPRTPDSFASDIRSIAGW